METYKPKQTFTEKHPILTALAFFYVIGGSSQEHARGTTGHPSADIYLGISKPTKVERFLIEDLLGMDITTRLDKEESK